jgi:hypothetical protein
VQPCYFEVPAVSITVHIYPLSRLVHASAGSWESQLNSIEEGKIHAYRYYLPLREAVVSYCKSRGKRVDEILRRLTVSASAVTAGRGANPVSDNRAAFEVFVDNFHPRIAHFGQSFLREDAKLGCAFEGVRLAGLPHFSANDSKGETRYVYLHASKWDEDDLKAYLELLSVIVGDKFDAPSTSIWCMDLRTGKDYKWKSSARVRTKCVNAARLYARLIDAMQSPK